MALTGIGIPQKSIRFGDCELNASAFELRRGRRTVKLERIPVQVLLMLIEQHGKVVTRDAIADRIWGKGVFVDVDNGINTAIRKIRQVLNDDPQNPRFVETIAGVGYRFIAPLEPAGTPVLVVEPPLDVVSLANAQNAVGKTTEDSRTGRVGIRSVWIRIGGTLLGLLLIAGIGGWIAWRHFAGQQHMVRSIAVLPLQNLSGDPSEEYFSDGVTEQLITDLAKVGSLRVISRTSVMQYKGTKKDTPEIGRELNVDAIVEGSVIRSGKRVRVTAQLVQAQNDQHLWAETYDHDRGDILNLQSEVADAITQQVRTRVTATQQARLRPAHAMNPAAYDDYLRGRFYFDNGWTKPDSLREAQQYFEKSIQTDPNFAPAYAGLANTYIFSAFAHALPRDQAYRLAREASAKALQLDDSLGEAYETLGMMSEDFDWDWEAADREYNRALALAPSYSCAHESRAVFLALMGRRDEAVAEIANIDQLDFGPGAVSAELLVYRALRDYPNLVDASKRALLLNPNDSSEHYLLGLGYEGTGKLQEAIPEYQKAVESSPDYSESVVALAHAYLAVGRKAEAEKMLRDLESKLKGTADSSFAMAKIYAVLGENGKALEFLEKAYSEKTLFLPGNMKSDLVLDSLHSDPRFQNLLRRMGLNN
jgi:TolB-like protein/DNA-binding winged helix-turn-helix (wHTH) protein/Tfp pilus assembly protein PilF